MRVYTRYKTARDQQKRPEWPYWVGVALLLVGVIWFLARTGPKLEPGHAKNIANDRTNLISPPTLSAPRGQPQPVAATRSNTPPSGAVFSNGPVTMPQVAQRPGEFPRAVENLFEAQVALARQLISPGSIDGVPGGQTRAALAAFQRREHLPETGSLDAGTRALLKLESPAMGFYMVTTNDLARLQPLGTNWVSKSRQDRLDYETALELVSEKNWSHPGLIRRLNPEVNWTNVAGGTLVRVPSVGVTRPRGKVAFIRIQLAARTLEAFDAQTNLMVHFPCSIAQKVEKRPVGELHVKVIALNPNYLFDPENFPESPEARKLKQKLVIQPGPNNPVGAAWMGLDKPGYGIHGTPRPEEVGRTESHGCFRLSNWNAEALLPMCWIGLLVQVES